LNDELLNSFKQPKSFKLTYRYQLVTINQQRNFTQGIRTLG